MPDSLNAEEKAEFVAAATVTRIDPDSGDEYDLIDYNLAAALAWEHYAATGAGGADQVEPQVATLGTQTQTIGYGKGGGSRIAEARRTAAHYRARSRIRSVRLGGTVTMDPLPARYADVLDPMDEDT